MSDSGAELTGDTDGEQLDNGSVGPRRPDTTVWRIEAGGTSLDDGKGGGATWVEALRAAVGSYTVVGAETTSGMVHHWQFDAVTISQIEADVDGTVTVASTPRAKRHGSRGLSRIALLVPLIGSLTVNQQGREATVRPGELVALEAGRPHTVTVTAAMRCVVVSIRRASVASPPLNGSTAVSLGGPRRGSGSAVVDCLLGATVRARNGQLLDGIESYLRHLAEIALSIARRLDAGAESESAAKSRVLAYMSRAYRDPGTTPAAVSQACGMSTRSLSRLFQDDPVKFTERLREIRVEHAQILLSAGDELPLSTVAAVVGFGGLTQFHRAFHQVTGQTPAAFRARTTRGNGL